MKSFHDLIRIERSGMGGRVTVDGVELICLADEDVVTRTSPQDIGRVTVTLAARRVEVVDDLGTEVSE